jgi:molybdopterin-guanine dinucleotide biosynthesis protein A
MQLNESSDRKIPASAAIFAGGKSKRFGTDKAFMKFDRHSVTAHLSSLLQNLFNDVFIVSNEKKNIIENQTLHTDIYPDKGPLGGLYTALKYSEHSYCFVTACDTPFINEELIKLLWERKKTADAVIPVWEEKSEPLAAFYNVRCISKIEELFKTDILSLKNLIDTLDVEKVDLSKIYTEAELRKLFFNINTAENFVIAREVWKNHDSP